MRIKVGIILLNGLIIAGLLLFSRSSRPAPEPWAYDSPFPPVLADLHGKGALTSINGELKGHYGLVFYCSNEIPWQRVHYARVLLDRYQSVGNGLRVVLLLHRRLADQAPYLAAKLGYGVAVDRAEEIRDALRMSPESDATFIVSPDGRLKLVRTGIAARDELRQHVEKVLLGEIFYEPSVVTQLGSSTKFHPVSAVDVRNGQVVSFPPPGDSLCIVLTASLCASCNTEPYYDRIERWVGLVRGESGLDERNPRLLLSASYPTEEVLLELASRNLELDVYQATETLRGLEDDYFPKRGTDTSVLVLKLDASGEVTDLKTIDQALEELTRKGKGDAKHS